MRENVNTSKPCCPLPARPGRQTAGSCGPRALSDMPGSRLGFRVKGWLWATMSLHVLHEALTSISYLQCQNPVAMVSKNDRNNAKQGVVTKEDILGRSGRRKRFLFEPCISP